MNMNIRMWTLCVLYILGLNICQTAGQENSTQMYYFKMKVEESAILNISAVLKPFVKNTNLTVNNLTITTNCRLGESFNECTCKPSFRWSDRVCQESGQKCCGLNCTFTNTTGMCVSNNTVSVNGSLTLTDAESYQCLQKKDSEEFKQCNTRVLKKMKAAYSVIRGFDILTISTYRAGSVIADFQITFASQINQQYLIDMSKRITENLSASLNLQTYGVVRIIMPPKNPVCHNDKPTIRCTVEEDLEIKPVWQLKRAGREYEIFDGTEAEVTKEALETNVSLNKISELWGGEYKCLYSQIGDKVNINHTASAVMNVSLLPEIDITLTPPFPRCTESKSLVTVKVKCEITKNNGSYKVTWTNNNLFGVYPLTDDPYTADVVARCNESHVLPNVACNFQNTCGENKSSTPADVNIIYGNDTFCKADGDWKETKAGFEAVLKCTSAAGQRKRNCPTNGEWEAESSTCVKNEVNNVLQKAKIIDIGLGSLDDNAGNVFKLLQNVTNNSETINTGPDIGATVSVLSTLSQKLKNITNISTVDDFLESSSNMLNKSLKTSWTKNVTMNNSTLAEIYLDSFEHLIHITNLSRAHKEDNIEAVMFNCSQSTNCSTTLFNSSVTFVGQRPGDVRTAGLKQLGDYLPNTNETFVNSIIISVTVENAVLPEVRLKFSLNEKRPANVEMKCVAWDNNSRSWSQEGCKWDFSNELCICSHLSSFAILMSKTPLEVPGLTLLTLVGLSVSVVSIILTIAIELTVWGSVVKTDQSYIRHTAHINICLSLLVADCCFLATPNKKPCPKTLVLLKHFSFLSVFFWMFSLSSMLLHSNVFVFHTVSRKAYLRLSLVLGYVCPLLIVIVTFVYYDNGAEGKYYCGETCWLMYTGLLKGSIHSFVLPVGTIVFFNVFSMVVVIIKLLDRSATANRCNEKEKKAAVTVIRSVILLTPIFGVTWIFGFAVMFVDLTSGPIAYAIHYAFTLLNTFQGLFILLTICLADKMTREVLLKRLRRNAEKSVTDSTTVKSCTL